MATALRHPRFGTLEYRLFRQIRICEHGRDCPFCCHEWQASTTAGGYGYIGLKVDGKWKKTQASRLVWIVWNDRPCPDGLWILHHCDNRSCCNIWHLRPGTPKDNSQDAVQRGRFRGRFHGIPAHGKALPQTKLTEEDVLKIRQLHAQGAMLKDIGEQFGIANTNVHHIVNGETWKHVPMPETERYKFDGVNNMLGERHHMARLTEEDIITIRTLVASGVGRKEVAKQFAITYHHVNQIVRRRCWKHIP